MSGRCKSCDVILDEWEMKKVDPLTGKYTEFCDCCLTISEESDMNLVDIDLDSISIEDVVL